MVVLRSRVGSFRAGGRGFEGSGLGLCYQLGVEVRRGARRSECLPLPRWLDLGKNSDIHLEMVVGSVLPELGVEVEVEKMVAEAFALHGRSDVLESFHNL